MTLSLIIGGPLIATVATVFNLLQVDSFSSAARLDIELAPIEYRDGSESTTVRKLNGLNKYANITLKWNTGEVPLADWSALVDGVEHESGVAPGGTMMIEIEPPTLVIPAR